MSALEDELIGQIALAGLPLPTRELVFAKDIGRRWRFDLSWPDRMIAAEVEGGTWSGGRHTRGSGFEKDCQKYNTATEMSWRVVRFTAGLIHSGEALSVLKRLLQAEDIDGGASGGCIIPRDGRNGEVETKSSMPRDVP